ncbi:hypothetical protein KSP40_PGU007119 [Platanthera guangdongensis]|uniref:Uncharacterized protein n=1 Tax=Platanthera guangdongensis TaxID=2320717 RepID=A0ABR2MHC8_9ASPA
MIPPSPVNAVSSDRNRDPGKRRSRKGPPTILFLPPNLSGGGRKIPTAANEIASGNSDATTRRKAQSNQKGSSRLNSPPRTNVDGCAGEIATGFCESTNGAANRVRRRWEHHSRGGIPCR